MAFAHLEATTKILSQGASEEKAELNFFKTWLFAGGIFCLSLFLLNLYFLSKIKNASNSTPRPLITLKTDFPLLMRISPKAFYLTQNSQNKKTIEYQINSHSAWQLFLTQTQESQGTIFYFINGKEIPLHFSKRTPLAVGNGPTKGSLNLNFEDIKTDLSPELPLKFDLVGLY